MARLPVNPKELHQDAVPGGTYRAQLRDIADGRYDRKETGFAKPGDQELNLQFQLDDPSHPDLAGRTVFKRVIVGEGRADQFIRLLHGFGWSTAQVSAATYRDSDDNRIYADMDVLKPLIGTYCLATVTTRTGKPDEAGEVRTFNDVRAVAKL